MHFWQCTIETNEASKFNSPPLQSVALTTHSTHSGINSSSNAKSFLLNFHASPSTPQPNPYISATIIYLLTLNSKSLLNLASNEEPSSHISFQNNVDLPSPTTLWILSNNHLSSNIPLPNQMWFKFFHQANPPLLQSITFLPSLSHLALRLNTLNHKISISSNTL